jgi:hypothetical protein
MTMQGVFEPAQPRGRADLAQLEQALRAAVMEAHVNALNELDLSFRRGGDELWSCSVGMVANFTSNLARMRNRNLRPCASLAYQLAA